MRSHVRRGNGALRRLPGVVGGGVDQRWLRRRAHFLESCETCLTSRLLEEDAGRQGQVDQPAKSGARSSKRVWKHQHRLEPASMGASRRGRGHPMKTGSGRAPATGPARLLCVPEPAAMSGRLDRRRPVQGLREPRRTGRALQTQNMSNNAGVTPDGLEMGRAQIVRPTRRPPPRRHEPPAAQAQHRHRRPSGRPGKVQIHVGTRLLPRRPGRRRATRAGPRRARPPAQRLRPGGCRGAGSCAK